TSPGGFDIESLKKNALIATIVGFVCGGAIPGVLGLLGYLKADQEPETAKKFTKWAWIAFGIIWALGIVLVILYFIIIFAPDGAEDVTPWAGIAFGMIWPLGSLLFILYFIIAFAAVASSGSI